jgi:hypothetical protein
MIDFLLIDVRGWLGWFHSEMKRRGWLSVACDFLVQSGGAGRHHKQAE